MRTFTGLGLATWVLCACTTTNGGAPGTSGGASATPTPAVYLSAVDLAAFCSKTINECGVTGLTQATCEADFGVYRVTQACITAVEAATCTDIKTTGSPLDTTCFPSCSDTNTNTCESDSKAVRECSDTSSVHIADCAKVCAAVQKTFTGSCGGTACQNSKGQPACCCQ